MWYVVLRLLHILILNQIEHKDKIKEYTSGIEIDTKKRVTMN